MTPKPPFRLLARAAIAAAAVLLAPPVSLTQTGGEPSVRIADGPRSEIAFEPAWRVDLDGAPERLDPLPAAGKRGSLVLVSYVDKIESRRTSDGSLIWSRDDLDAWGLHVTLGDDSVDGSESAPRIGWSGNCHDRSPCLRTLDPETGRDTGSAPLPAEPVGPPFWGPSTMEGQAWFAPCEGGLVVELGPGLEPIAAHAVADPVAPKGLALLGHTAFWAGSPTSLRVLGQEEATTLPNGGRPATTVVEDRFVAAFTDEGLCAWRCRETRRGRVKCKRSWCQRLGANVEGELASSGRHLVAPSWDTFVYAFRWKNGHLVWRHHENQRIGQGLTLAGRAIFVLPDASSRVVVVSEADGTARGELRGPEQEVFLPSLALSGERLILAVRPLTRPEDAHLDAWVVVKRER